MLHNSLKSISVDGFLLSPVFDVNTTNYVVWLPYETESVKVNGRPADNKASVEVIGGENLVAGQDNKVLVVCTAENGNKKEYTVTVKRAAAHDGSVGDAPVVSNPETPDVIEPTDEAKSGGVAWWWLLVASVVGLAAGVTVALVVLKPKREKIEE